MYIAVCQYQTCTISDKYVPRFFPQFGTIEIIYLRFQMRNFIFYISSLNSMVRYTSTDNLYTVWSSYVTSF